MRLFQPYLLRRTAVALAAVAGFSITAASHAAVVTLTGSTGSSCSYSSMSVAPDGSFNVQCTSSSPTPPAPGDAGSFSFASATGTAGVPLFTNYQFPVTRSAGSTGVVNMDYTVGGPGCYNGLGYLTFPDGSTTQNAQIMTILNGSTCTITLGTPTTTSSVGTQPRLGTTTLTTITVPSAGGPTPNTAGCPSGFTAPADIALQSLGGLGNPLLSMVKSGQVVSMQLPATQPGYSTGQVAFSESAGGAYTPQPVTLTISISKCQGMIDTDTNNRCNIVSTNGNYNSVTWFSQPYSVITDASRANGRGYCWAPASEGPWYVNAKWTYGSCAFGAQVCGFAIQQNYGPY
jgi:hypothetical protein